MATKSKKKKPRVVVQREYASPYTREEALALAAMFWNCVQTTVDLPDHILDTAGALMCRICDQAELLICNKCAVPCYAENCCPCDGEECE